MPRKYRRRKVAIEPAKPIRRRRRYRRRVQPVETAPAIIPYPAVVDGVIRICYR